MLDLLADEEGRLSALRRYDVLDTAPEEPFDKITSLVRSVLDVPMAAVSLIDRDRQWFKSRQGIDACETGRDVSFCGKTILGREPMVIPDARLDDRFRDNPLVVGPPHVVSYAGAPLTDPEGYNIGALCAIDMVPRDFTAAQVDCLVKFGALVVRRARAAPDRPARSAHRRAHAARPDRSGRQRDCALQALSPPLRADPVRHRPFSSRSTIASVTPRAIRC